MSFRAGSFQWLSGKGRWRAERVDRRAGEGLIWRQDSKAGLFTEGGYEEAQSPGKVAETLHQAVDLESWTLSGVKITVEAINRTPSVSVWS